MQSPDTSSKPVSRSPSAWRSARSRATRRRHVGDGDPRGRRRARPRKKLEHCGGDDAERAFAAQKKLLQVVPGVVLAQAAQAVPDLAIGEHHFEPQHQLARVAVAQHRRAAGVGGQVAADRATAFGGKRQREQHLGACSRFLDAGQRHAGLDRHRRVVGIDRADAVQSRQGQHDLIAGHVRRRAAAKPCVAALGHDGYAVPGAAAHDRGDLVGRSRARRLRARGRDSARASR